LRESGLKLKTAESFTGGAVAAAIVIVAGASEYFDEGLVCYSAESKTKRLGVKKANLDAFGAVSLPVLRDMLQGLLESGADIAVATTGNAGPLVQGGAVGECYVGAANRERVVIKKLLIDAEKGRGEIIQEGVKETLKAIIDLI